MEGIFVGRQPILNRDQDLVGFELLFRSGRTRAAEVADDISATASVVVNTIGELGLQNVLGHQKGFINVSSELLLSDMIFLLPREQVVLELLETVEASASIVERCRELRQRGYRLALDDVIEVNERVKAFLPLVELVKLDLMHIGWAALPGLIHALRPCPVLAEKVESRDQADRCLALGCELFQGYYFARPEVMAGKRASPSRIALLRLLALFVQDAEVGVIEQEFKRYPNLVYQLMRLVNSVACGLMQKLDSPRQCIMVLGRSQLQRWVQLLLYTVDGSSGNVVNPLLHMAAARGKWMEALAMRQRAADRKYHDRAFMVGILSLIDALLGMPLPAVVSELNLPDDVRSALLAREGPLGRLLMLIESKECDDAAAVSSGLRGLSFLTMDQFSEDELRAAGWANAVAHAA